MKRVPITTGGISLAAFYRHHVNELRRVNAELRKQVAERTSGAMKCVNCKYFDPDQKDWWGHRLEGSGVCERIVKMNNVSEQEKLARIAWTEDGSDYLAELWVTENFGCVLWEEAL